MSTTYKKMAGTAAVFVFSDYGKASPVERDGLVWSGDELHCSSLDGCAKNLCADIANVLALEGLEDYDPPTHADVRHVASMDVDFIFIAQSKAWVQL